MASENLFELHLCATMLGVDRKHYQDIPGKPHYDICQEKKKKALKEGWATEVNDREIVKMMIAAFRQAKGATL